MSIEQSLPIVDINGLNTNKDTYLGGTLEVVGVATFDATPVFAAANFSGAVDVGGALGVGGALTATGAISSVGTITAKNAGTATGGTGTMAIGFTNTSNYGIYYGSGVPAATAATGSLYLRYDGSGTGSRAYMNAGGATWIAIITSS